IVKQAALNKAPDPQQAANTFGANRIRKSRFYRLAMAQANRLVNNPTKLKQLAVDVTEKSQRGKKNPLAKVKNKLGAFIRLVKAVSKNQYRDISWYHLTLIVSSLIYFMIPTDVIPDFIAGLGYLDDATLLGWTYTAVRDEIDRFLLWE